MLSIIGGAFLAGFILATVYPCADAAKKEHDYMESFSMKYENSGSRA